MIPKVGILQFFLSIFFNPILYGLFVILLISNEIVRLFLSVVLRIKFGNQISLVSDGADGYYGYKKPGSSRNSLIYFTFPLGYLCKQKIANFYQKEIQFYRDSNGNRIYEKLEKILVTTCGYFCWKMDSNFSVYNHIRVLNDKHVYSVKSVQKFFSSLAEDMEDSKPQWEMILIPNFDDSTGEIKSILVFRYLHAYMDALSFIMLTKNHIAPNLQYKIDPLNFKIPWWQKSVLLFNALIYAPLGMIIFWMGNFYLKTWINIPVTDNENSETRNKYFAWVKPLSVKYESVRRIMFSNGRWTSVTNVICTAFISSVKKVLPENRLVKKLIVCEVVANLPYLNSNPQNRILVIPYEIPVGSKDVFNILRKCKEERQKTIFGPDFFGSYYFVNFVGRLPWVFSKLVLDGLKFSVILSNAPASKTTINLKDGTPILDIVGFTPLISDCGISIGVTQLGDDVKISVCADSSWLSQSELNDIVKQIPHEINNMAKLCTLS